MDFLLGNGSELEFYSKRYEKPLEYSEKRSGMGQFMLHQCFVCAVGCGLKWERVTAG